MVALATNTKWWVKDNGTTGWTGVIAWAASTVVAAGLLRRQLATPTVGNERVFASIVGGTTGGSEPTWVVTKGGKTTDNTVTWQEVTGLPALNGDTANSPVWVATRTVTLGQVIYDSTSASVQIASSISGTGTTGSSTPTFSATAGTTTTDNAGANQVVWTSLGLASGFTNWAAPHARVSNALTSTWAAAGDRLIVSNTHADTVAAANTLAVPGTKTAPCQIVCVSNAAPTTVSTGASIATTGANSLTINGFSYWQGITFSNAGGGSNNANLKLGAAQASLYFENCSFVMASTNASPVMQFGLPASATDLLIEALNCTFVFGATGQSFQANSGQVNIIGGSFAATGTVPTTLLTQGSSSLGALRIRGCDLSAVTGTLCGSLIAGFGLYELMNCRIGSGVALPNPTSGTPGTPLFRMHNCDSAADNYRFYEAGYLALIQQETTVVNTSGGGNGTTQFSLKLTSGASTAFGQFYSTERLPFDVWNNLTGSSRTLTMQIAGSATLTNADFWIEVEYPSSASYPLYSIASSRCADVLTSPTNIPTSSASWGGSPAVTQQASVTFTPQMAGPLYVRLYLAKPSTTVYVDSLPVIT